jgi:predicted PhzF superfamily epimerase YddE/YHI9
MASNEAAARVSALRIRGSEARLHETRMKEMPFAGHPNVGTAFVLASQATKLPARFLFKKGAGLVPAFGRQLPI